MKLKWIIMLLSHWTFCTAKNEFYSSTDHMTQLIGIKKHFSQCLENYISALENQTCLLKRVLQGLDSISDGSEDPEKFISNPLTAYKLVRQLRNAGTVFEEVTKKSMSEDLKALMSKAQVLPSESDLEGIAMAMLRLQDVYRIDPKNFSGLENTLTLDPDETFHIAVVAHQNQQFQSASLWIQETLKKLDEGTDAMVTKQEVLHLLGSVPFQAWNLPIALGQLLPPGKSRLYILQFSFNHVILKNTLFLRLMGQGWGEVTIISCFVLNYIVQMLKYCESKEVLIRSYSMRWYIIFTLSMTLHFDWQTPQREKKLACRYTTGGGNPLLIYAPAKEEEEWDQPLILRYHDLLSISDIEIIKRLSRPKLDRATVSDPVAGKMVSMVRVSKSAWLSEDESPVVARANQRIAAITGLDMETAEELQVANYGIGGQYEPHYDSRLTNDSYFELHGERIATVLVYMTDVEIGGATVFPNIGAALQPKRGSAVVWFNLLKSGKEDARTLHAACPVFAGNKWVANKWIHTRGQEFRRKCSLSMFD
ncbi:prolyl 4-hydroxylase subunit alpha-1 [Colossoma macropomum]|uniref:prolyl 4-hydroxylase subunit alpha-1 n=1 Tax=Colossoma macropomum TaxID=42526 RepID=UPI0018655BF4|nr:prolyl 4-hydroxylase subunit alpha-1 [Colossoma macropomum]